MPAREPEFELEPIDDMAYYQLSLAEKVHLGWTLTWPLMAFAGTMRGVRFYVGEPEWIGPVLSLLVMFVLGPWVVRQAVRMNFPSFHLAVIRHGSLDYTRAMTYKESLPVLWLMIWRASIIMAGTDLLSSPVMGSMMGLAFAGAVLLILQIYWLNRAMTEKIYADFCLVIRRAGADRGEGVYD